MLRIDCAEFRLIESDRTSRRTVTVLFNYPEGLPATVEVIVGEMQQTLDNADRYYKPRVEDCKKALQDSRRRAAGYKPLRQDARDRRLARMRANMRPRR